MKDATKKNLELFFIALIALALIFLLMMLYKHIDLLLADPCKVCADVSGKICINGFGG